MKARYKTAKGEIVCGVTTIIGDIIAKPALIHWAWKLGMENRDYRKERDKAGDIGSIAHYLIKCHLKNEKPKLEEYANSNIEKAETAFLAFLDFEKQNKLETKLVEEMLISEKLKYGGTPDWYGFFNGELALLDFKSGKYLYPEFKLQIAAYKKLLEEHGYEVKTTHLLQIDKDTGEFHHYTLGNLDEAWQMFELLLQIYPIKKRLWKR